MPEDKLLARSCDSKKKKKKKKKRKKAPVSTSPAEQTDKPQAVCLTPETSPQSPDQPPPQSPDQPPPQSPGQPPPQSPGQPSRQSPGQPSRQSPGQLSRQSPGQPSPQSPVQLPKLRSSSRKDGEQLTSSSRRSKRHPKDPLAWLTSRTGELDAQARESLRWEGVLQDPQAEEKRLELYRANRRQRYISHRDALIKDTLRQTFPGESEEEKGFDFDSRSTD